MSDLFLGRRRTAVSLLVLLLSAAWARAQTTDAQLPPPSQNLTINLINRLVLRGALTKADADELIRMAEDDTRRAQAAAANAPAAAQTAPAAAAPATNSDDTVHVAYVPEIVKRQIREELKNDVLAQARSEGWAAPRLLPEWLSRYRLFGDFRLRYEGLFYPKGNDNTGAFPNFNAINTGSPFDVAGAAFSPQINVDQTRTRIRLRARAGVEVEMGDGFTAGMRAATGDSDSPVSANQSLGTTNGEFSKYALWLDRAFVNYAAKGGPGDGDWIVSMGRFDDPYYASSMIFYEDLAFDGVAAQAHFKPSEKFRPFLAVGAFPIFDSSLNFSSIQPAKFKSENKWLYAAQIGSVFALTQDLTLKGAGAYYYFDNIAGRASTPFTPLTAADNGDTDETRPSFAQNGNTYFPLRTIVPNALNGYGTTNQFQYFGLATPFEDVAATGELDYDHFAPFRISLAGEFVTNIAFRHGAVSRVAVNNLGAGGLGDFVGGNNGYNVEFKLGDVALIKRWDWNTSVGYRYLESDAVLDGINDPDFGVGGTNLKGYFIKGSLGLTPRVWVSLRWFSATSIAGPRFQNDTVQIDFNGKF